LTNLALAVNVPELDVVTKTTWSSN